MESLEHTMTARRITRAAAVAAALALVGGCMKDLPTGSQGELTAGINIYQHTDFLGESAHLESDVSDFSGYNGPCKHESTCYSDWSSYDCSDYNWDDCISSIKVAAGWRATIYRDNGFDGEALYLTADTSDLRLVRGTCDGGGLNDCISSIRVQQLR